MQFYNYLAAVEVQPQSVAAPTHKFTNSHVRTIGAAPLPGQTIDCPGQILQIRDCPRDSGTVGAYAYSDALTYASKSKNLHFRKGI